MQYMDVREKLGNAGKRLRRELGDVGERLAGRGRQVDFRKEVERLAEVRGMPVHRAEKAVLLEKMDALRSEVSSIEHGPPSESFDAFEAGLRHIFGNNRENLQKLDAAAEDPDKFEPLIPPQVSPSDAAKAEKYFEGKYNRAPAPAILGDYARRALIMEQLIERISADPRIMGSDEKLDALLVDTAPERGADVAGILDGEEHLKGAERHFARELAHEKNIANLKETARKSLAIMLFKAPGNFALDLMKTVLKIRPTPIAPFKFMGRLMVASGKFAFREGTEGAKLFGAIARTTTSYLNTKRK
jgi:hypothetical protein